MGASANMAVLNGQRGATSPGVADVFISVEAWASVYSWNPKPRRQKCSCWSWRICEVYSDENRGLHRFSPFRLRVHLLITVYLENIEKGNKSKKKGSGGSAPIYKTKIGGSAPIYKTKIGGSAPIGVAEWGGSAPIGKIWKQCLRGQTLQQQSYRPSRIGLIKHTCCW